MIDFKNLSASLAPVLPPPRLPKSSFCYAPSSKNYVSSRPAPPPFTWITRARSSHRPILLLMPDRSTSTSSIASSLNRLDSALLSSNTSRRSRNEPIPHQSSCRSKARLSRPLPLSVPRPSRLPTARERFQVQRYPDGVYDSLMRRKG
jgi:hypothetical protein